MTQRIIALYHNPWPEPSPARPRCRNPAALFKYAIWYKSNPRDADYMHNLMTQHFPDAQWVNTCEQANWRAQIAGVGDVVLLYPDAIGLGFSPIEKAVFAEKAPWASVRVLNGRHRSFLLSSGTHCGLRFRRFLEWSMLPELLFLPAFIVATPVLWLTDVLRGRT